MLTSDQCIVGTECYIKNAVYPKAVKVKIISPPIYIGKINSVIGTIVELASDAVIKARLDDLYTLEQLNSLELEFKEVSQNIHDKIKESAKLLRDSLNLARNSKLDSDERFLHKIQDDLDKIANSMVSYGWSASSLSC